MSKFFSKGWRPTLAWILLAGIFVQFVVKQVLAPIWPIEAWSDAMLTAAVSLLVALGGMRTVERVNGKIPKGE